VHQAASAVHHDVAVVPVFHLRAKCHRDKEGVKSAGPAATGARKVLMSRKPKSMCTRQSDESIMMLLLWRTCRTAVVAGVA
jgi:hypothetical protein